MARTKQTARMWTGVPAPAVSLHYNHRPVRYTVEHGNLPLKRYTLPKRSLRSLISDGSKSTDTSKTSEAQKTVLSTPDILVLILSQLPHSSLLNAKLVNTTWASLFKHVEIQASLFQCPRPEGSAAYVEPYSDLFVTKFSNIWPLSREDYETTDLGPQWRKLLVCQPAVEVLEFVQEVSRRGSSTLQFRGTIHRPEGLRMGFLFDAIKHWHENEKHSVELLWNRSTGDLNNSAHFYPEGEGFKTHDSKPCITIHGSTSVGCGQHGGLTYESCCYGQTQEEMEARFIESGDEHVELSMSEPQVVSYDMGSLFASRVWDRDDDEEAGQNDEIEEET